MVLGKLPVPEGPTNLDLSRAMAYLLTALAVDAGGCCWDMFSLVCHVFFFSLSLVDGPI